MSGDGQVDELELREFLLAMKKENRLRKDVDTKVSVLMAKYDIDDKGFLTMPELTKLQTAVCIKKVADPEREIAELNSRFSQQQHELEEIQRKMDLILTRLGASSDGPYTSAIRSV